MPNSVPISSLKICTVWTSDCKLFSFLAYNFKSSMKRRWFILSLLLRNWYAFSDLLKITVNGIRESTSNKGEGESRWKFLALYPLPLEIAYYMSNPLSMLSYFQTRNALFLHSPQPYQDTLQFRSVELYMLSYNKFMWLLGVSFSFVPPKVSFCQ